MNETRFTKFLSQFDFKCHGRKVKWFASSGDVDDDACRCCCCTGECQPSYEDECEVLFQGFAEGDL